MSPTAAIASPATGVAEHRHCEVCGLATQTDGRVCSAVCQAKFEEALKARKRGLLMVVFATALILLFTLYGGKLF